MRILHTSDWHLGRLFHGASLHDDQVAALDRIVDIVRAEQVELVVVAGDLYDRAIPAAPAVELFDDTLARLRDTGASVVAISGNHDSGVRVGYGDRLLTRAGVTVRGSVARAAEPVLVPSTDGGEPVVVYPVPYLDPVVVAHLELDDEPDAGDAPASTSDHDADPAGPRRRRLSHHEVMAWATARARADLQARSCRSVLVAHTFVTQATPTESERAISQGAVDQVGLEVFDDFDYVALGHLHRPQSWHDGRVAYSGTPLPYSFSEEGHTKSVRLIDLAPDGTRRVQVVPLGAGRALRSITGPLDSLLTDPALADAEGAWVRATLTDRHLPMQAMPRLRTRFPHAVELRHTPPQAATDLAAHADARTEVREARPLDLAVRFLGEQRGIVADPDEQALLATAFHQVQGEVAS